MARNVGFDYCERVGADASGEKLSDYLASRQKTALLEGRYRNTQAARSSGAA